jgi:hypothetical protein
MRRISNLSPLISRRHHESRLVIAVLRLGMITLFIFLRKRFPGILRPATPESLLIQFRLF